MSNSQRFKDIEACAKAIKLRIPFERQYDNVFDMLDGIIELCKEPEYRADDMLVITNGVRTVPHGGIKWSVDAHVIKSEGAIVTAYMLNENWHTVGIPKRQPFHEQVFWAGNKGATQVKAMVDGQETIISITQYKQK